MVHYSQNLDWSKNSIDDECKIINNQIYVRFMIDDQWYGDSHFWSFYSGSIFDFNWSQYSIRKSSRLLLVFLLWFYPKQQTLVETKIYSKNTRFPLCFTFQSTLDQFWFILLADSIRQLTELGMFLNICGESVWSILSIFLLDIGLMTFNSDEVDALSNSTMDWIKCNIVNSIKTSSTDWIAFRLLIFSRW